jgi:hypothetical protein
MEISTEVNPVAGYLAGFIGTLAMMTVMRAATAAGMTDMPSMPLLLGSIGSDDPGKAKWIGTFVHVIFMGTFVIGTFYASIFSSIASAGLLTGLVVGLAHGVVAGLFMKLLGVGHTRMRGVSRFPGGERWRVDADGIHVAEPGWFGVNYGKLTPVALLMAHALFGMVAGAVYAAAVN